MARWPQHLVIALCSMVLFATAKPLNAAPLILTPQELDRVTAGATQADATSLAVATGDLVRTDTDSVALALKNDGGAPHKDSFVAVADASATTLHIGAGGSTTSVDTNVSVDGTHSQTYLIQGSVSGSIVDISFQTEAAFGFFVLPGFWL